MPEDLSTPNKTLKRLLGVEEIDSELVFKCFAIGMLVGKAVASNNDYGYDYPNNVREQIEPLALKKAGIQIPYSDQGFTQQQAEDVVELFSSMLFQRILLGWP